MRQQSQKVKYIQVQSTGEGHSTYQSLWGLSCHCGRLLLLVSLFHSYCHQNQIKACNWCTQISGVGFKRIKQNSLSLSLTHTHMHARTHACHTQTHTHLYICTYAHKLARAHSHTHTRMHTHVCTHTHTHILYHISIQCMHMYTLHTHTHARRHAHMQHIHTPMYTHTHTHTKRTTYISIPATFSPAQQTYASVKSKSSSLCQLYCGRCGEAELGSFLLVFWDRSRVNIGQEIQRKLHVRIVQLLQQPVEKRKHNEHSHTAMISPFLPLSKCVHIHSINTK